MSDERHWVQRMAEQQDTPDGCPKCEGCGQIADDDDQTPWSVWMNLPVKNAGALMLGLVQPIPCPRCNGTGKAEELDS